MTEGATGSAWNPARRRLAALGILTAALTGAAGVALGATGWHAVGAVAFLALAVAALVTPTAITILVIGGQGFAASLLFSEAGPGLLSLLPIVVGVLATAELLAVVDRMARPFARDPGDSLRRVGAALFIGAAVFGVVAGVIGALDRIPVPTGLTAVALGVGACVVLAWLFVRAAR